MARLQTGAEPAFLDGLLDGLLNGLRVGGEMEGRLVVGLQSQQLDQFGILQEAFGAG